jgi:nucleoside-diphosphate-sugar epimerase
VLADHGTDVFALLISWLGPLAPIALADDSAGGVEAEAIARVTTLDGAPGTVVLSRLRSLPNSIVLTATKGRIEFDLERSRITADPPALLDRSQTAGASDAEANAISEGHAAELIAELRAVRERLVHVWEDDSALPSATVDVAARIAESKVLVTGGTGFIGSRLVEMLCEAGAQVTVVVRDERHVARIRRFDVALAATDLRSSALDDIVAGHDIVFSLAYDFRRSGASNVALHRNLADACARRGVRRFVHASSIAVYDDWPSGSIDERSPSDAPGSEYKIAKRAIELDLARRQAAGTLACAVLQPTIVYGPFSRFWTDRFAERLIVGAIELPRSGLGTCNGVYVDDVVAAALLPPFVTTRRRSMDHLGRATFRLDRADRRLCRRARPAAGIRCRGAGTGAAGARPAESIRDRAMAFGARSGCVRARSCWRRAHRSSARTHRRARRASGPSVYRPADEDPALYRSRGVCAIGRARRELGFRAAFDLESGLRRTCDYIRWRYESKTSFRPTACVAIRCAFAIAENVIVVAGMLGNTDASTT